jgi:hypothetical protein
MTKQQMTDVRVILFMVLVFIALCWSYQLGHSHGLQSQMGR